jgi:hypothetical protein
MEELMAQ